MRGLLTHAGHEMERSTDSIPVSWGSILDLKKEDELW